SSFAVASYPIPAAQHSGVLPELSLDSNSAPFSSSSFATTLCPFSVAHNSGVLPNSIYLDKTPAYFNSSFTTMRPIPAAQQSSVKSTSSSFLVNSNSVSFSRSSFTTPSCSSPAAHSIPPYLSLDSSSALFSCRGFIISRPIQAAHNSDLPSYLLS